MGVLRYGVRHAWRGPGPRAAGSSPTAGPAGPVTVARVNDRPPRARSRGGGGRIAPAPPGLPSFLMPGSTRGCWHTADRLGPSLYRLSGTVSEPARLPRPPARSQCPLGTTPTPPARPAEPSIPFKVPRLVAASRSPTALLGSFHPVLPRPPVHWGNSRGRVTAADSGIYTIYTSSPYWRVVLIGGNVTALSAPGGAPRSADRL